MLTALAGQAEVIESVTSPLGYHTLKVHIADDGMVRKVVATANEAVELRSFSEVIPSMNDLFIRAVAGTL